MTAKSKEEVCGLWHNEHQGWWCWAKPTWPNRLSKDPWARDVVRGTKEEMEHWLKKTKLADTCVREIENG